MIKEVLVPYINKIKKERSLPATQKSLLLWDAFKAQSTDKVMGVISDHGIESVMVPKNMTHLLQPLDLTTNASFKKHEKKAFSDYFTSSIIETLKIDPNRDVYIYTRSTFVHTETTTRKSDEGDIPAPPIT